MKMKKIFGILLTLAMVIGLLPGMALTAYAEDYNLWVGGKRVTSANALNVFGDGKVNYTPANGDTPATLTLNGYSYEGVGHETASIYYTGGSTLNIVLKSDNKLTSTATAGYGIYCRCQCSVIISGSGTLTVNAKQTGIHIGYTYEEGGTNPNVSRSRLPEGRSRRPRKR